MKRNLNNHSDESSERWDSLKKLRETWIAGPNGKRWKCVLKQNATRKKAGFCYPFFT